MTVQGLLTNRNFRLLFTASAFTNLGDGCLSIALPWFASALSPDPFLIGLVASARQLPWLMLSLPAGVITDRFNRQRLILICDGLRLCLAIALLFLVMSGVQGTAAACGLAGLPFALGSAEVLRDNTAQTILPQVVGRQRLEQANGLIWATEHLGGQFVGPPLAGLLIGVSLALPFGFQAAMLAAAIGLVGAMALPVEERPPHKPFMPALREGMAWLWRHDTLRRLALVLGLFNFLSNMTWAIMVLYAQRVLGLDAVGYGLLLSALAVGGLVGSLTGPMLIARTGPNAALFIGIVGFGVSSLTLALVSNPAIAGTSMAVEAFSGMVWNLATVSYRQRHIPHELLGRVNAAYRFFGTGTNPLGALTGGALVAAAAPWGDNALHLPFALAFVGAVGMLLYSARYLRLR